MIDRYSLKYYKELPIFIHIIDLVVSREQERITKLF